MMMVMNTKLSWRMTTEKWLDFNLRHIKTNTVSANFLVEFGLTPPDGLPGRIPQVTSVFVDVDYHRINLSQHVYRLIIGHYGVVLSDTHQSSGGMVIWLQMAEDDAVQINDLQVRGGQREYRLINGQPEAYIGEIENLELAGDTIWGIQIRLFLRKLALSLPITICVISPLLLALSKKDVHHFHSGGLAQ
jgi:hypothetical protein